MKNVKALLATLLACAMVFALAACSVELGGEETWEYSGDDKESATQVFRNFFEGTYAASNLEVSATSGGTVQFKESIDGTSDCSEFASNGTKAYSFMNGDEYVYAVDGDDSQYYMTGKENYEMGRLFYKNYVDVLDDLPEDGQATFSCVVKGSKKDGVSNATLTLEIKNGDQGSIIVTATARDDLVQTAVMDVTDEGQNRKSELTFTYGSAKVTLPDISTWSKVES